MARILDWAVTIGFMALAVGVVILGFLSVLHG
jgi:hypothetical protein